MEISGEDKQDRILVNNLILMVKEPEQYYDIGIASYILQKVGSEKLNNYKMLIDNTSLKVESNFLGYIYHRFNEIIYLPEEEKEKLLNKPENELSSVESFKLSKIKKLSEWKKLLKPYFDNINTCPNYTLLNNKKTNEISSSCLYAIKKPFEWISYYINQKTEQLSTEEELVFTQTLLNDESFNNQPKNQLKSEEVTTLLNMVIKNQKLLKSKLPKNNNEIEWIKSLVKNETMLVLLSKGNIEDIKQLFNEEGLKFFFKKINEKAIVENFGHMFLHILKMETPEKWIKLAMYSENFDICSVYHNKFNKAYNVKLKGVYSPAKGGHKTTRKIIHQELEYLAPALKEVKIQPNILENFWQGVLSSQDVQLLKIVAKILPLPEQNDINTKFYEKFNNMELIEDIVENGKKVGNKYTAKQWYEFAINEKFYDRLDTITEDKAEKINKPKKKI